MNLAQKGIEKIRRNIAGKGLTASGRTAASLGGEDTGKRVRIYMDGSGAPPRTLEKGRAGGRVPANFRGIIKQWIIDKGISVAPIPFSTENPRPMMRKYTEQERGINKMAYFVSRKIAREGTERHKNNRDDIYTPVQEFVIEEFTKRWTDNVINEFLK